MRTKKEIAEKLEEIKKLADEEYRNEHQYEDEKGDRTALLLMTGWLEALNFVLKRPIDKDVHVGRRRRTTLPELRLD